MTLHPVSQFAFVDCDIFMPESECIACFTTVTEQTVFDICALVTKDMLEEDYRTTVIAMTWFM